MTKHLLLLIILATSPALVLSPLVASAQQRLFEASSSVVTSTQQTRYPFSQVRLGDALVDMPIDAVDHGTFYRYDSHLNDESYAFTFLVKPEANPMDIARNVIKDLYRGDDYGVTAEQTVGQRATLIVEGTLKNKPRRFKTIVMVQGKDVYVLAYSANASKWETYSLEREAYFGSVILSDH